MLMTTPGPAVGVSVFLDPIIEDLGLTRSLVSLLYMLGTLTGSLACGGMALVQGVLTLGLVSTNAINVFRGLALPSASAPFRSCLNG
jgi:hypothetical protein